jgi:hypothetical protein
LGQFLIDVWCLINAIIIIIIPIIRYRKECSRHLLLMLGEFTQVVEMMSQGGGHEGTECGESTLQNVEIGA